MTRAALSELNAFLAVAEKQSFSGAAKILGLSPSALSHSMRSLEEKLQLRLFNRTTRSVALTDAGEKLFLRLKPLLLEMNDAVDEITSSQSTPKGVVRISASEGAFRPLVKHVLPSFTKKYPEIHVELIADSRLLDIVSGGYDAGIRIYDDIPQDMISVRFGSDIRFAAVASPSYLEINGSPTTPEDLRSHRCIRFRFSSGTNFRWDMEKDGRKFSLDVNGPLTLDNIDLMVEAALNGIGIAWIPHIRAAKQIETGELVSLLEDWCPSYPGLCLYYPANRHPPQALRLFVEAVRSWVEEETKSNIKTFA